ncbi:MAG: ribosome silencing factor [Candidatus Lumbricidophila eiseniae]|uniref:Ribosomal silencing factor RsfS n=1 Tax=Candidatus Lumbricidiphila eiseniae TaxID=1969409 RepID=A0A2A6FNZ5_9MICO|nr:MAG: ribosome silencing factor [Candidatus Lumbricidophila eiseniae]
MTASELARELVAVAVEAAASRFGEDIVVLDVSERLAFTDIFVFVTANSERNVIAIADAVEDALKAVGIPIRRREGYTAGRWILLDFGDFVLHVFHPEERMYYGLERLWADCPVVSLPPQRGGLLVTQGDVAS